MTFLEYKKRPLKILTNASETFDLKTCEQEHRKPYINTIHNDRKKTKRLAKYQVQ